MLVDAESGRQPVVGGVTGRTVVERLPALPGWVRVLVAVDARGVLHARAYDVLRLFVGRRSPERGQHDHTAQKACNHGPFDDRAHHQPILACTPSWSIARNSGSVRCFSTSSPPNHRPPL